MTETKPKYNWDEVAEKGNSYEEMRTALNALETYCVGLSKDEIYTDNSKFKDEFKQDLETRLNQIIIESLLPESDKDSMKKEFLKNLKNKLELIVIKGAYAQITFSQFHLHKFFEALDSFVDEIEIEITEKNIKIITSDPSRIGLMEIIFGSKSYQFFRAGKVGINVEDLKKKLKGLNDNSEVVLVFTEKILEMIITSPKRKRTIKRTLIPIDFEKQDIPMDALNRIVNPYTFEMTKDDFGDLMNNSGYYSEIIDIIVNQKCVFFKESGNEGDSEIDYKKRNLVSLTFNEEALLNEIEKEQDQSTVQRLEQTFKEKACKGSYSLSFLKVVKNFSVILDLTDKITFSIKSDTPLKVEVVFKKIDKTRLTYYLAPRVPEVDFDEDEDEDFDEEEEEINNENQEEDLDQTEE